MPGIYHVYVDLLHIHGIYLVYSWIYHVHPSDWIYMVYPSWIYHVYPPSIYMVYPLAWICMVYHWMYMHGIYVVYRGISMDTPSFLNPDFAACPCCWSHSMRTRVWVIKSVLFHAPPWQLHQGKRQPTKGSRPLFPAAAVAVAAAAAAAASIGGGGGGGGGGAGFFPGGVTFKDFLLSQGGG